GGDTDPHLTKGRRGMALATAPTNQRFAEAIYRFDLVVTSTLPAKHYGAGAGERSRKDRHGHEAWDLAPADQVGLEVRLLAQVAPGSHQRQGSGLDAASEGQDDVRAGDLSYGR